MEERGGRARSEGGINEAGLDNDALRLVAKRNVSMTGWNVEINKEWMTLFEFGLINAQMSSHCAV